MEPAFPASDEDGIGLNDQQLRDELITLIGGARHMVEPFEIGDWTIPPNVSIIVDAYAVHNDPETYPEPHVFRPERFLGSSADAYSLLSFGGGAHRCIGASLAQLEMKIVLREILARLDLAPVSDALARPVPRGPTLAPRGGAKVRIVGQRTPTPQQAATVAAA